MPVTRIDKPINVKPVKKRFDGALDKHGREWPKTDPDGSRPVPDLTARDRTRKMSDKAWRAAKKKAGIHD